MKILFFSPYFYPYTSGVTTYPLKILSHLSKKNKVTALTFLYDKKLSNQVTHNQITIKRMPFLFKVYKGFISPQSLIYFLKLVKSTDLLILNQPNFEGLFLAIFGRIFRKKIISIFHCQVFLQGNFINKIINSVLNFSMNIQLFLSYKIVVYTKDYIDSLPNFKLFKNKTLEILPPIKKSTEDKNYLKKLLKFKENNIWIGYGGRISSEKGLEYLIDAIKQLNNETINIVFAGPYGKDVVGENVYYTKIVGELKEFKIKHLFLGNLTSKQLSAFYKTINMLVLPSINQTEAFGMVQAEAMINGTPVIASNLPGVRMPIKLTKMGIVTEQKNINQLIEAIKNILGNKNEFTNKKLIKNAQLIFDIKKVYKFYENLIYEKN
ncbi:MAG: glycosyltransferase family 4 protein [Patescibacteria group bacterium]